MIKEIKNKYKKLWEKIFNKRKKSVGEKKAKFSANAAVYAECLKEWNKESKEARLKRRMETWKLAEKIFNEDKKSFPFYKIGKVKMYINTNREILNYFDESEGKGIIDDQMPEYHKEILNKVIKKYNLELDPKVLTYYVIKGA